MTASKVILPLKLRAVERVPLQRVKPTDTESNEEFLDLTTTGICEGFKTDGNTFVDLNTFDSTKVNLYPKKPSLYELKQPIVSCVVINGVRLCLKHLQYIVISETYNGATMVCLTYCVGVLYFCPMVFATTCAHFIISQDIPKVVGLLICIFVLSGCMYVILVTSKSKLYISNPCSIYFKPRV